MDNRIEVTESIYEWVFKHKREHEVFVHLSVDGQCYLTKSKSITEDAFSPTSKAECRQELGLISEQIINEFKTLAWAIADKHITIPTIVFDNYCDTTDGSGIIDRKEAIKLGLTK